MIGNLDMELGLRIADWGLDLGSGIGIRIVDQDWGPKDPHNPHPDGKLMYIVGTGPPKDI